MSHHPTCKEQHVPPPADHTKVLGWEPYDGSPLIQVFSTCTTSFCTNVAYRLCAGYGDRYALARTDRDTGETVILTPADQGSVLATWLDLLNGTAI